MNQQKKEKPDVAGIESVWIEWIAAGRMMLFYFSLSPSLSRSLSISNNAAEYEFVLIKS